jgi:hypothetical protein
MTSAAEGPPLAALLRRLAECPAEFLAAPKVDGRGVVAVDAVVGDLLRDLGGGPLPAPEAETFGRGDANRLNIVLVAAWLLHDEWFLAHGGLAPAAGKFLAHGLEELTHLVAAERFVTDPDRREELARRALAALELVPHGEGEAEGRDRLAALDSAERSRVIAASREAERRAREVREAMQKKAAAEAAASYGRE